MPSKSVLTLLVEAIDLIESAHALRTTEGLFEAVGKLEAIEEILGPDEDGE